MRDVDDWLRDTRGPDAPPPPSWERPRRWPAVVGLLAVAAAAVVAVVMRPAEPRHRGFDAPVRVDLQLALERGGVAVRLAGTPARIGERVFFRVAASTDLPVRVWVDAPAGRAEVAELPAGPAPRDVADADGLVAWRFDGPGTYVFHAAPADGAPCPACPVLSVEVSP